MFQYVPLLEKNDRKSETLNWLGGDAYVKDFFEVSLHILCLHICHVDDFAL